MKFYFYCLNKTMLTIYIYFKTKQRNILRKFVNIMMVNISILFLYVYNVSSDNIKNYFTLSSLV